MKSRREYLLDQSAISILLASMEWNDRPGGWNFRTNQWNFQGWILISPVSELNIYECVTVMQIYKCTGYYTDILTENSNERRKRYIFLQREPPEATSQKEVTIANIHTTGDFIGTTTGLHVSDCMLLLVVIFRRVEARIAIPPVTHSHHHSIRKNDTQLFIVTRVAMKILFITMYI